MHCVKARLPRWLRGKESACTAGAAGSIPGSGRSPGGANGSSFRYSCLGNPMDRGAYWATVHGVQNSRTPQSDWSHTHTHTHTQDIYYIKAHLLLLLSCFSRVRPTLCDPIDGSPPGSPVPGILQARTLEWVAISFSSAWKWKVSEVAESCPTLRDPMDCSPPGSSVHGIFQARVLEWGAIAFSKSTFKQL